MKKTTNISIVLLLLLSSIAYGQVQLGRQVIGSTGSFTTGSTYTVSSTVGEAVIATKTSANLILTQGFQQTFRGGDSTVTAEITNESCRGAKDGKIEIINVLGCPGSYVVTIIPLIDTSITLGFDTLSAGVYIVNIVGVTGCNYTYLDTVGLDSDEDCLLKFYSGITPNGDGVNDVWWIDNIEQFPENTVRIFNRWGTQVWFGKNYDNVNVVWEGLNEQGEEMADATYFYIVKIDGMDKIFKSWVELTR